MPNRTPEEEAREEIDRMLEAAGGTVIRHPAAVGKGEACPEITLASQGGVGHEAPLFRRSVVGLLRPYTAVRLRMDPSDPGMGRARQALSEPCRMRWLRETWLLMDRSRRGLPRPYGCMGVV